MKTYNKEQIENLINDYIDLKIKVESIVEKMIEMKGGKINGDFLGIDFEKDEIIAKYESQSYMDYEIIYHSFPVEYLYDENWKAKFAKVVKAERERINRLKEQKERNIEFIERKEYEKLKAKFEQWKRNVKLLYIEIRGDVNGNVWLYWKIS